MFNEISLIFLKNFIFDKNVVKHCYEASPILAYLEHKRLINNTTHTQW